MCVQPLRHFATPWTVACWAPLPMDLLRQEYWSGLPKFLSPGDLSNPGIEPRKSVKWLIMLFFPIWVCVYTYICACTCFV